MPVERERDDTAARKCLRRLTEWLLVTAIFAAAGAWPTPDTNEAHYLARARHAADPAWAAGDFFLETPEAHGLFARALGPLTTWLSLDATAWVGRLAGWGLLALGFMHAARSLLPAATARILAAAMFSLALRHTTAAGEWLIGGCEAKVFAWAGVLWAAGDIARGQWGRAWAALGAATAVHPVVGGWGMGAAAAAWIAVGGPVGIGWLLTGIALAAVGVVPVLQLTGAADAAVRAEAARIYVVDRLSHHLLPRSFADGMISRHVLAILVWWLVSRHLPASAERRRLDVFTGAAVGISLVGLLVSLCEPFAPAFTYGLLRFYWFRLADGLVPLSLALAIAAWMNPPQPRPHGPPPFMRWAVVALLCLDLAHESRHWPLPGREPLLARSDRFMQGASWRDICGWVRDQTPADARFLVPRMAGSFVWRTGRREVVCWKNIPQGPQSLVDWRQRIVDCYSRDGSLTALEPHASRLGPARVLEAARRYGADYVIVPAADGMLDGPSFERLHANGDYAVYRITP
jgi:hypothetical protein